MKRKFLVGGLLILVALLAVACSAPRTAVQEAMKIDTYTTWKDITEHFHPEPALSEDEAKLQSQLKIFQVLGLANGSESKEITHDSWGAIVHTFYPYGAVARGLARGEKDAEPLAVTTTTTGAEVLQAVDPEAYAAMSEEEKSTLAETTVLDGFGWATQRFEFKPAE